MTNAAHSRPPLPPVATSIPAALRDIPRWVIWGFVDKGKAKPAKVPFRPGTSSGCNYTAPENWQTFADAYAEALDRGDIGIGFVFTTDDDLVAVDLDQAIDDAGELRPWAAEIVDKLPTWAERSPSGRGLHLIGRGGKIFGKVAQSVTANPPQAIERYSQDRYLTFTGDVFRDTDVADIRGGMEWLAGKWFPESKKFIAAARACEKRGPDPVLDVELARVCLRLLRPERSVDAADWRRVGYALKATDEQLVGDWLEFSRRWPDFNEAECRDRWNRFRPGQVGLQTLMGMAADDSGKRFTEIRKIAAANLGRETLTPRATAAVASAAASIAAGDDLRHSTCADLYRPHTLNDVGLARRLAKTIRGRLAYLRERQMWFGFDGKRWAERADHLVVQECKRLHDELWREVPEVEPERRMQAVKFVQGTGTKRCIDAMASLAKTEPGINVSQDQFDAHPWLLNVENGVLDLRSGELRPHDPGLRLTQLANVNYQPEARSELWERFIRDVTCGDEEIANFLQQAFGLALTGDVSDEVLICHNGGGCNGKSTALEAVAKMLGDYAAVAPPGLFTARNFDSHPTEIAALHGKRFVTAIEQEANRALRESLVKSLTGGDTIRTRRMREDFWEMRPTWHIHVAYNRAPRLTGTDDGIRRRLRVVPWAASFKDRPDLTIKERLIGPEERPGILAWCLEGLRRRLAIGRLESPAAVMIATDEYIDDEDLLGRFIADRCTEGPRNEAEIRSTLAAFRAWMIEDGAPRHVVDGYTVNMLGRELARRGFTKRRPDSGPHRKRVVYVGLSLSTACEYAQAGEDWENPFR